MKRSGVVFFLSSSGATFAERQLIGVLGKSGDEHLPIPWVVGPELVWPWGHRVLSNINPKFLCSIQRYFLLVLSLMGNIWFLLFLKCCCSHLGLLDFGLNRTILKMVLNWRKKRLLEIITALPLYRREDQVSAQGACSWSHMS